MFDRVCFLTFNSYAVLLYILYGVGFVLFVVVVLLSFVLVFVLLVSLSMLLHLLVCWCLSCLCLFVSLSYFTVFVCCVFVVPICCFFISERVFSYELSRVVL